MGKKIGHSIRLPENLVVRLRIIINDYWYVSYDSGTTWQKLGKATGPQGNEGKSLFSSVEVGANEVTFVLADGTAFNLPMKISTIEHEYVDLGLPSGTLWATCNVGADVPWEYGDYFAWGETETKNMAGYDWVTYKYCNDAENKLTKYGFDRNYGIVDNKIALEPIDDAATVNWGSEWQTPSSEQVSELLSSHYTLIEWKNMQYGVNGIKITSKNNGNCIFLSAAGSGFRSEYRAAYRYQGEIIYYWTRSLSTGSYRYGGRVDIVSYSSMGGALSDEDRCKGLPIRPVRKK